MLYTQFHQLANRQGRFVKTVVCKFLFTNFHRNRPLTKVVYFFIFNIII